MSKSIDFTSLRQTPLPCAPQHVLKFLIFSSLKTIRYLASVGKWLAMSPSNSNSPLPRQVQITKITLILQSESRNRTFSMKIDYGHPTSDQILPSLLRPFPFRGSTAISCKLHNAHISRLPQIDPTSRSDCNVGPPSSISGNGYIFKFA